MTQKEQREYLLERLTDALEGNVSTEALRDLETQAKKLDTTLWADFLWMKKAYQNGGALLELKSLNETPLPGDAIKRFHERKEQESAPDVVMEMFAWKLFRRYALATALFLIVFVSGTRLYGPSDLEADNRQELTEYLGWNEYQDLEPEYWLIQD